LSIYEKIQSKKAKKQKVFWLPKAARMTKRMCFWGITASPKIGILEKLVRLEARPLNHMFIKKLRFFEQILHPQWPAQTSKMGQKLDFIL
jgi:hypothetical protein